MLTENDVEGGDGMSIELRAGVPNVVGAARLFVFGSSADGVRLGIVLNGEEIGPRLYRTGDVLSLGDVSYRLTVVAALSREAPRSAPGVSAGRIAATLDLVAAEPIG